MFSPVDYGKIAKAFLTFKGFSEQPLKNKAFWLLAYLVFLGFIAIRLLNNALYDAEQLRKGRKK
ncbi:hypothetical protein [Metabacillus sp. SLBN-84]